MKSNIDFKLEDSILSFFESQCAEQLFLTEKAQADQDEIAFTHHYKAYGIAHRRLLKEANRIQSKLQFQKA